MMTRVRDVVPLELSTAETELGPRFELGREALVVCYDAEGEGGVVWTRLRFAPVFAARFTADPSVQAWMIGAYSKVCEVEASTWIQELTAATEEGRGPLQAARHFVLYFDDFGCLEVVARDVEVVAHEKALG
jgi:hypothetical protein